MEHDPDESLNLEFTRSSGFTHDATGHQGQAAVAAYVGPAHFALKPLRFRRAAPLIAADPGNGRGRWCDGRSAKPRGAEPSPVRSYAATGPGNVA